MRPIQCCLVRPSFVSYNSKLTCKTVQGQGGAQCIEDGVVLGLVLCGATHENIPERLKLYENIRRNRASLMQVFSNAGQDEAESMHEKASKYMPIERVPSMSPSVLVPCYLLQSLHNA